MGPGDHVAAMNSHWGHNGDETNRHATIGECLRFVRAARLVAVNVHDTDPRVRGANVGRLHQATTGGCRYKWGDQI